MKKLAAVIVEKRRIVLIVFVVLALAGAVFMNFVPTNYDMTSYLPDDSSAKKGVSIMAEEFGESSVVNLMFKDLSETDRDRILAELPEIGHVDSVLYEADSADYNKDGHTLFVVNIAADSFSPEAADTLRAIEDKYKGDYDAYTSGAINDSQSVGISASVLIIAFSLLIIILFVMCSSWIEPLLFLIAIGIAILLNEGTNIVFPHVSSITKSIAAILQLVLSMDYSIMLIDRYRQERELAPDKETAMKNALKGGFLAIAGSSATTIVGLLCLIFMSFTIGMDMGLVLAKGVFFSLVSILFVLPALVLMFDKAIQKTKKKTPRIPMGAVARFGHKFRFVILAAFLALFTGGFLLKDHILIDFSMSSQNPDKVVIEAVFPPDNTIVLLYENKDEDKMADLLTFLEDQEGVTGVSGYASTLGKPYTAAELAREMGMDESLLNMLYYEYFKDGETGRLTLPEFMTFITEDISQNEQFAAYFTEEVRGQLDSLAVLADPEGLTAPRGSAELAKALDLDVEMADQLFLLYQLRHGSATARMNLREFVRFVREDIAADPQYASYIDKDASAQLDTLAAFTDPAAAGKAYKSADLARLLGMEAAMADQLYYLYHSAAGQTAAWSMKLPEFFDFLLSDVVNNEQFAAYFDEAALARLNGTKSLIDAAASGAALSSARLAAMTGMDAALIDQMFAYASMTGGSPVTAMTLPDFLSFILEDVSQNPQFAAGFDENTLTQLGTLKALTDAARSGQAFKAADLAAFTGLEPAVIDQLFYLYHGARGATADWTMTPAQFVDFIVNTLAKDPQYAGFFDAEQLPQLTLLQKVMDAAASGKTYSASEMAGLVGMKADQMAPLYLVYQSRYGDTSGWKLSLKTLVDFIAGDVAGSAEYAAMMDADMLERVSLAGTVIDAVLEGKAYTAAELAALLGDAGGDMMDADTLELMYLYVFSGKNADAAWRISLYDFIGFVSGDILTDPRFAAYLDDGMAAQMKDAKVEMEEGKAALVGAAYSRLIINTAYGEESPEAYALIEELQARMSDGFGQSYPVGNSPVAHEMSKSFTGELNFITLLTVISVFLVVAVTFKSLAVPAILVLLIQCAVYLTTAAAYLQGTGTYYLALIIVQAILMGATIDYAILYTEYYRQLRRTQGIREAMAGAYKGSIMTILTSSSILFSVTLVVGLVASDPTTAQVCLTIAKGSFFAALLVIFVLPALLAICDRLVCRKGQRAEPNGEA